MRDILRRVRQQRPAGRRKGSGPPGGAAGEDGAGGTAGSTAGRMALPLPGVPEPEPVAHRGREDAETEPMSAQMLRRVAVGLQALAAAEAEGRKHLCLTDPDARMMFGGRERSTAECYSFEVAVDNGLLVVGQSSQESHDNTRLEPLVEAAGKHEPGGVTAVDADSGYYT